MKIIMIRTQTLLVRRWSAGIQPIGEHMHRPVALDLHSHSAAYLENREGGGARARRAPLYPRRAPLHPRRAPYGRHWRDISEGLFVVGGRLRAPSNYIFPVKHSRLEGAKQSQKA